MEPRKDPMSSTEKSPDPVSLEQRQATPRKRFRLVRLEERIAPACHLNTHNTRYVGCGGPDRTVTLTS
jgi:hypothetical protein